MLTIRLRGQRPRRLRRTAASVDPVLQFSGMNTLDALYREYTRSAGQLALVIVLVSGSVLLLSAAGIHALMSFTVSQRRREIGIRSALGGSPRLILTSVLARATRQRSLGVRIGLAMAVGRREPGQESVKRIEASVDGRKDDHCVIASRLPSKRRQQLTVQISFR